MGKKRLANYLLPDERRLLLDRPSRRYPTGIRNRAIMATMLYGGLRCAEVLALRPRDVNLSDYLLRVRGKGKKERAVPISTALEPYLVEWRARRPPGPVFFSTLKGSPIHGSYVREMVKRYGRKAGLEVDVHPHLLRHTAATAWLNEERLTVREVQVLLGHERLETTERYTHVNPAELVRKLRR